MSSYLISCLIVLLAGCGLGLFACNSSRKPGAQVQEHSPSAAAHELVKQGATLLDVRTPEEYEAGHLSGATLIPIAVLEARLAEVSQDKPIVVYCRSGRRSAMAANLLKKRGYEVHDLGAMAAW